MIKEFKVGDATLRLVNDTTDEDTWKSFHVGSRTISLLIVGGRVSEVTTKQVGEKLGIKVGVRYNKHTTWNMVDLTDKRPIKSEEDAVELIELFVHYYEDMRKKRHQTYANRPSGLRH